MYIFLTFFLYLLIYIALTFSQDPPDSYSISIDPSQYEALFNFYNNNNGPYWTMREDKNAWNFNLISDPCLDDWDGIGCECLPMNFPISIPTQSPLTSYNQIEKFFFDIFPMDSIDLLNESNYNYHKYKKEYESSPLDFFIPIELQDNNSINLLSSIIKEYREYKILLKEDKIELDSIKERKLLYKKEKLRRKLYYQQLYNRKKEKKNSSSSISYFTPSHSLLSFPSQSYKLNSNYSSQCTITKLYLPFHNITGELPSSFSRFLNLTMLDLSDNSLNQTFPIELLNLANLTYLQLNYNYFYGELPQELINLTSLQSFSLLNNYFYGNLSQEFLELPSLTYLNIESNLFNFSFNSIDFNQKLTKFEFLYFGNNFIYGNLSFNITQMNNLYEFSVSYNNLEGKPFILSESSNDYYQIPPNLINFSIDNNNFSGDLPLQIFKSSDLNISEIHLNNNLFKNKLNSTNLHHLKNLYSFQIQFNFLSGLIPEDLVDNLSNLNVLYLNNNNFTGSFPTSIIKSNQIKDLDISYNFLIGNFDTFQFNYESNLTSLILSGNFFSGTLDSVILPQNIKSIVFDQLNINGTIPENIYNISSLSIVSLADNNIIGTIPKFLSTNLTSLTLESNQFHGEIPQYLCNIDSLYLIYLSNNNLSGELPECFGNMKSLSFFDISNLDLSGNFPSSFLNSSFLQTLNIFNNKFKGNFINPNNSNQLTLINSIDLGTNYFTGNLPTNLITSSNLEYFSASRNCFDTFLDNSLCSSPSLLYFNIDGLHTADKCITKIFPNTIFDSFIISGKDSFFDKKNEIPTCLFNLPSIISLHLGGNNYYGDLSKNLNSLGKNLNTLYLAHNYLSGEIPIVIQNKKWVELDLSFNYFNGIINDHFNQDYYDSKITLKINRLSGRLPNSFNNVSNIEVLEGNLYKCPIFNYKLPENDPYYVVYSCGSNSVDFSIYSWLFVMLLLVLSFLFLIIYSTRKLRVLLSNKYKIDSIVRLILFHNIKHIYDHLSIFSNGQEIPSVDVFSNPKDNKELIKYDIDKVQLEVDESTNETEEDENLSDNSLVKKKKMINFFSSNMWKASLLFDHIRIYSFYLTSFIVFFFLPLNSILSQFYSMYTISYTWTVSSVYLSGKIPSILLSFSYSFILFLFFYYLYTINFYEKNPKIPRNIPKKYEAKQDIEINYNDSFTIGVSMIELSNRDEGKEEKKNKFGMEYISNPYLEIPNRPCMKLIARTITILNFIISLLLDIVYVQSYKNVSSDYLFIVQLGISLFKVVWIDFLWNSFHIIQRNIYYYQAWKRGEASYMNPPPLPESLIYYVFHRFEISTLSLNSLLNLIVIPFLAISVSSSECFYNGFIAPPASTTFNYLCEIPVLGSSSKCMGLNISNQEYKFNVGFEYRYECSSSFMAVYTSVYVSTFINSGLILPIAQFLLSHIYHFLLIKQKNLKKSNKPIPKIYTNLINLIYGILPSATTSYFHPSPSPSPHKIFSKHQFLVDLCMNVVLLFSFGVIYPPLAFIICVHIWISTFLEQYSIGKLLKKAYKKKYFWYYYRLNDEFEGIWEVWKVCILFGVPAIIGFTFGFVIFDMIGDKYGWKVAMPPLFIFFSIPIFLKYIALYTLNFLTIFPTRKTDQILKIIVISPMHGEQTADEDLELNCSKENKLWSLIFFSNILKFINRKNFD